MIDLNYDFCNRHRHDAQPCKSPPSKTLPRCGLCGLCGPQKLPLWLEGAHMRNVFEEGVWASPQGRAPPDESNRLEQLQEGGPRVQLKVWSLCIIFAVSFVSYRIFRVLGINTLFTWPPANAANFGSRREGFPGWGGEMRHPMKPYCQRHFTSLQAGSQINPHRPRRRIFLLLPPTRPAGITHHSLKPYRQRHSSSGREPRTPRRPRRR